MKNFIKFCKEKYKILIPIMVGIVLITTVLFLYKEYEFDNKRNKKEVDVFQYFIGLRVDYTAIITYNLKDVIVDLKGKDRKINYDSNPVYYKDSKKVIFPKEMSIVFPLNGGNQYKLYKYSTYYKEDTVNYITSNKDTGNYDDFFLYDGDGLFFFPNKVKLEIDNKEYKKLGELSYVNLIGSTLIYYDAESDIGEVIELDGKNVSISSENININITEWYFKVLNNKVLLNRPSGLKSLFN